MCRGSLDHCSLHPMSAPRSPACRAVPLHKLTWVWWIPHPLSQKVHLPQPPFLLTAYHSPVLCGLQIFFHFVFFAIDHLYKQQRALFLNLNMPQKPQVHLALIPHHQLLLELCQPLCYPFNAYSNVPEWC